MTVKSMSPREFTGVFKTAWTRLDAAVEKVDREEMLSGGFCGHWSVKDVLAHISWYENQMIQLLKTRILVDSDLWRMATDDRNDRICAMFAGDDLGRVLERFAQTHKVLAGLVEDLDHADLNDPAGFQGMPEEWRPWQVLAENTYMHYDHHLRQFLRLSSAAAEDQRSN